MASFVIDSQNNQLMNISKQFFNLFLILIFQNYFINFFHFRITLLILMTKLIYDMIV